MLAADCLNVGLFCKAIRCSSSSVIVFCAEAGVCARPGKATRNKAQEKHSTNRDTQQSGDTVSSLTCINFSCVVRLFMFVLHPRHVHLHWLIAFLLFSKLHDVVVLVFSQHAYEGHHPRHEAAPAGTQTEVFRFVDHLIHRHHRTFHEGILRKARHGIRILADIGLAHLHPLVLHVGHVLVLHRTSGFKRRVCHPLFERRTDTHSASQAWTVFLRRSASLPQNPHAALHVEIRGGSLSPCHRTDIGRTLVHHVVGALAVH